MTNPDPSAPLDPSRRADGDHAPDEPRRRPLRRRVWFLVLIAVVPAAVLIASFWGPRGEHARDVDSRFDRHPMLDDADGSVCRAIRKAWNRPEEPRMPSHGIHVNHVNATGKPLIGWPIKTPWQKNRWDKANRKAVLEVLSEASDNGPLALLRVLVEEAPLPHHRRLEFRPACDGGCVRFGLWLRENAPPALDPLLLAMVEDENLHFELRMKAVVALCRPQSRASLPALAAVTNDPCADFELRSEIIQRLHRMEAPLLEHLEPLLYQPFHGLDEAAAMALALSGESQAPSLLLRMVRHATEGYDIRANLLGRAVWRTTGRDPQIRKLGEQFSRTHGHVRIDVPFEGEALAEPNQPENKDPSLLADAFSEWLEAHPEARNTRFEREHAAYLAGQRRRERTVPTFDGLLEIPEEVFDLGLAAAWGSFPETDERDRRRREVTLDRLHRLTLLLRRDLKGRTDPEAIIETLMRRLFPRGERVTCSTWEGRDASSLVGVLDTQNGNCVGNSVLLLAIGQRLGLPLHGVQAPGHMFVRWDDGETRRNIETTDHGAEQPDEDYLVSHDHGKTVTTEERATGTYLGNLSRRQAISMMFGNLVRAHLDFFEHPAAATYHLEHARKLADGAVRLAPGCAMHYLARAGERIRIGGAAAAIRRDFTTARRLDHDAPRSLVAEGSYLLATGHPAEALERFERAHAASPKYRAAELALAQGLLALDRVDEAHAHVEAMTAREPEADDVRLLRLHTLVRRRDARWTTLFEESIDLPDAKSRFLTGARLRLQVAAVLLRDEKDHAADPRGALAMLEKIPDHGLGAPPPDSESRGLVEPIKAPNGETIWIFHKPLREIETRRDELREHARAMVTDPEKTAASE